MVKEKGTEAQSVGATLGRPKDSKGGQAHLYAKNLLSG